MVRSAWQASVMASLNVAALILAVRFILLIAVIGAFALAWVGVSAPDPWRVAVLAGYAVIVVVPLIWLASRR